MTDPTPATDDGGFIDEPIPGMPEPETVVHPGGILVGPAVGSYVADEPIYGVEVSGMFAAAADSPRIRTQSLGRKAVTALDELSAALKREQAIADAEAALKRARA